MRTPTRRLVGLALALPVLLAAAACQGSVSVGSTPTVKAVDLASQVQNQLQSKVADAQVSCPDDLKGETGATATCAVTSGTDLLQATITVTSVEGSNVKFDIDVVPELTPDDTASQISDELAQQTGQTPDSVTCPGPLLGTVGTVLTCSLTAGTDTLDVTATVTSVDNDSINFDIDVQGTSPTPSPS